MLFLDARVADSMRMSLADFLEIQLLNGSVMFRHNQ